MWVIEDVLYTKFKDVFFYIDNKNTKTTFYGVYTSQEKEKKEKKNLFFVQIYKGKQEHEFVIDIKGNSSDTVLEIHNALVKRLEFMCVCGDDICEGDCGTMSCGRCVDTCRCKYARK